MTNLPAHISTPGRKLASRALQVVGTGVGPHISRASNQFALVDAAGNKRQIPTVYLDIVIVDINDHMSKMFFDPEQPYDPDNLKPPLCFSHNGVAPSTKASHPQHVVCDGCPHNVWGSKISNMGSEVKACRDEQEMAVIIPGMSNNIFQLTVPPDSLKNWRAYLAKFETADFDICDVITRLIYEEGKQGKLTFAPAPHPWPDDATKAIR